MILTTANAVAAARLSVLLSSAPTDLSIKTIGTDFELLDLVQMGPDNLYILIRYIPDIRQVFRVQFLPKAPCVIEPTTLFNYYKQKNQPAG